MPKTINQELLNFLKQSPSTFHAVDKIKQELLQAGFKELLEQQSWEVEKGGNYFTIRNNSSIIAFSVGRILDDYHFQVTSSHSDSPTYKVKEKAELLGKGGYIQLNTEGYGGMIASTWFDRPLSIAGRVLVSEKNTLTSKLFNIDKDLLVIPNVAIHLNREANNGMKYNNQVDLLPLFSAGAKTKGSYYKMLAKELGVNERDICGTDLYLYNRMSPILWGEEEEFLSAPKLDNLQCSYVSLKSFLEAKNDHGINVYACFDNEEVGSSTKQGAESTFLRDVLERVNSLLGFSDEDYYCSIAKSFMISCDNAHATHPNHPEMTDAENTAFLNKGIVIKYNANQRYTTDAFSSAIFKTICEKSSVPTQPFANRSDVMGGSTLGNISSTKVSMNAVDIGLPQLAMHSAYETSGSKDTEYLFEALKTFYNANIKIFDNNQIEIVYK